MAVSQEVIDRIVGNVRKQYPGWEGVEDWRFQEEEIRYKRRASDDAFENLHPATLKSINNTGGGFEVIAQRLRSVVTNMLYVGSKSGDLSILYEVTPHLRFEFANELIWLLQDAEESASRLQRFAQWTQDKGLSSKWTFVTYFLFLLRPDTDFFVKPTLVLWLFKLVDRPQTDLRKPNKAGYEQILALADELKVALAPFGVRDYLELQSVLWVAHQVEKTPPGEVRPKPVVLHPEVSIAEVSARTHVPTATLDRWLRAIRRKGQAVLYGPPGTGKTYLAKILAEHLAGGGDGLIETLQFHPSFGYEDFMEGLRPERSASGGLDYKVQRGRFVEFCDRAELRTGTSVLILDEINRANLARVFGELLYLLEYRDQSITLPSGRPFRIPRQVILLGTMNTADRSIALVDHALRRRFAFLRVWPEMELLRRFQLEHETEPALIEGLVLELERINQAIGDPHYHLGVSFFLVPDLFTHLEDIWELEVEPYLEEYFFDRTETMAAFRWSRVGERLKP